MSETITTTEGGDFVGRFAICERTYDDDGTQVGPVKRQMVMPGAWDENGIWVATDTSAFPPQVKAAAEALWTEAAVDRFKAQFPWVPPPPPEAPVLQPYQFFAILEISGKKAVLDAFIDALPAPQNIVARAKLDRSLAFHRDNDLVLAAQQALGLTDQQLDALWLSAAAL